jgi:hypothetical protein
MAPRVIDTIKGGTFVFSYAGETSWLKKASNKTCGGSGAPEAGVTAAAAAASVVGVAN